MTSVKHLARLIVLLTLLLFFVRPASAQKELTLEQRTKIIEKLPSPAMMWEAQFHYNSYSLTLSTEDSDAPTRLAKLLLKPVPKEPIPHVEHLLELAQAYQEVNGKDSAIKVAHEAEGILQAQKPTTPEEQEKVILLTSDTRWYQNDAAGAEKLTREAVRRQPKSWRAWHALSVRLYTRYWSELFGGPATQSLDFPTAFMRLSKEAIPTEKRERAEKVFTEADSCLMKAEGLAPKEPRVILARMVRGLNNVLRQAVAQKAAGKPFDDSEAMKNAVIGPANIALMGKLVEAQPEDPLVVGGYTFFRLTRVRIEKDEGSLADRFSPEERKLLTDTLARLEKIGSDTKRDPTARGRAWESAGIMSVVFLEDYKAGIRYFQEERTVDADRSGGWMGGIATAGWLKDYKEEYALAQGYSKRSKTSRTQLLLAKAAIDSGHLREAEHMLRDLCEKEPKNVTAGLALGVTLIKRSGSDPALLDEVATVIKSLQDQTSNHFEGDEYLDISMLAAAYVALTGNVQNGIDLLEAAVKQDPTNEKLKGLLGVVKEAN